MTGANTPDRSVRDFLPWVRRGLAGSMTTVDTLDAQIASSVSVPVVLHVNTTSSLNVPVRFYGPGNVTGIDPREIVRTEPRNLTSDFEPNYLPALEFDDPSFPWLFTPARADATGRLRPWLCLIAVTRQLSQLDPAPAGTPLPILTCLVRELPDLAEAWAWAHTQVTRNPDPAANQSIGQVLTSYPDRNVSRLICARRLDPGTTYRACVVPTFAVGRKTGLGWSLTAQDDQHLDPAWPAAAGDPGLVGSGPDQTIRLPVYYAWEFSTGPGGDFESLARRIDRPPKPIALNVPQVDVTSPGWTLQPLAAAPNRVVVGFPGALQAPTAAADTSWQGPPRASFQQQLRTLLSPPAASPAPRVLPPMYGQEQANQWTLPADAAEPNWIRELNLDPRYRAAAGMGALAVRFEQEALLTSAWDQLAAANRNVQETQRQELGDHVTQALGDKHLQPLNTSQLLQVMAPAAGAPLAAMRFMAATAGAMMSSTVPELDAAFRRLARPQGPFAQRLARAPAATALGRPIDPLAHWVIGATQLADAPLTITARAAATPTTPPPPFAPRFTRPAYELLRDYFPAMLLPGLSEVPPNTAAVLLENAPFIEAFMIGMNHEIVRELIWRGYPIDRHATPFEQFWQPLTTTTPSAGDLPPIASWPASSHLGDQFSSTASAGGLVLLLRSDLLRRYPRTVVSMVEGVWSTDNKRRLPGTNERLPVFRAEWGMDMTLLGFNLKEDVARGSMQAPQHPGWFFAIHEQPTEPRFGLDVAAAFGGRPAHWSDLSWGHLAADAPSLTALLHVPAHGPLAGLTLDGATWGRNSADMAAITLRKPFRIAIHASAWLPPKA